MATSNALIDAVAGVLAMNRSTCANVYRDLRTAGLVSNEGRGKNAAAMTAPDAATYLLAICGGERVQDASDAAKRYSSLLGRSGRHASGIVVPSPTWKPVRNEFPRLAKLAAEHAFLDALVALIESYEECAPNADVTVSLRGPYPWAGIDIMIGESKTRTMHSIWYSDNGDEDAVGESALIDESKARQRRRFVALGGDMNTTATISNRTLEAVGSALRS